MLKVTVGEDCGNAPKKAQLRDLTIAFVANDQAQILAQITDSIRWKIVGDMVFEGKDAVVRGLGQLHNRKALELIIHNVITHGNTGAVDGTVIIEGGKTYGFCNVCRFSSNAKDAKVKEITSYVIAMKH